MQSPESMATRAGRVRRWRISNLMAVVVVTASCATSGPIQLDMRYPEGAAGSETTSTTAPRFCDVTIGRITDARANKKTLGHLGAAPVYGEGVDGWVRRGLADLRALGHRVSDVSPAAMRLDVTLKQAYVHHVRSSIESAVRLTVRYTRVDGTAVERSYRGGYVKVNWTAAANEVMGTLNNAMIVVVRDIAKDLSEVCGG